ncbi:unnamed protein product, partial [Polarella glacialis]
RAELFAVVLALKVSGVPLWLRTDSEWVVGIWATILINGGTQNTSFEHDDLWVELWELYQRQPNARDGLPWIIVTKIKGHATQDDICSGIISALDAEGNRHADKLATDGAKKHSVPGHIRRRYAKIVRHTLWWQAEAILTILERNAKLKEAGLWNASHHDKYIFDESDAAQSELPQQDGPVQEEFPCFGWGFPRVGAAHVVHHDADLKLSKANWSHEYVLHDAIIKYFHNLRWAVNHGNKVSWTELLIDFAAATGIWPCEDALKQGTVQQQCRAFRFATKHIIKIHKCKSWPVQAVCEQRLSVLGSLGLPSVAGMSNVRPVFRCHGAVDQFLKNVARTFNKVGNPFNIQIPKLPCPVI